MSNQFRHDFNKLNRLPPYILSEVTELTRAGRRAGEDIVDLGMGNPDLATPHRTLAIIATPPRRASRIFAQGSRSGTSAALTWISIRQPRRSR